MTFSPDYTFALISSFFWALSVPILNVGINRISRHSNFPIFLFWGLLLALSSGTLLLGLGLYLSGSNFDAPFNGYVLGAGFLTFPIATGLYYYSAFALNNQAELASLFAKVKPLFSVFLAVFILGETFQVPSLISVGLIIVGLLIFSRSVIQDGFSWNGILYGLLTALAWSTGEIFVKVGFAPETSIQQTLYALSSALAITFIFVILFTIYNKVRLPALTTFTPFLLHGAFSFGIAYMSFFHSIAIIGVVKSVIITAFWPILALVITGLANHFMGIRTNINLGIWIAGFCFTIASLIQTLNN